jgi:protein-S-isoprenylcysteine O-methyltransferase Ste14
MQPPVLHESIHALVFYIALFVWIVPEVFYSRRPDLRGGASNRDRLSRLVLVGSIGVATLAAFRISSLGLGAAITSPQPLIFGTGIGLMVAGVGLRWYAVRVLGRYFTTTVFIQSGQKVVEKGPYRYVRHPSYTGVLITLLGVGLALSNWASLAAIILIPLIGFGYRIAVEERALQEGLGRPYVDYMKRTRRLLPWIF